MLANVTETDSPLIQVGQPVEVSVMAYPGRVFQGKIAKVGAVVDPNTHRLLARYEIADPKDELRPGMLADFVIRVKAPVESLSIPATGVVRNGDGTMAVWVTVDRRHFTQKIIKVGLQKDGQDQVLEGLASGETVVTEGAIFLNNMLEAPPVD
jgi:membrane fusion protein, heavy metal efflux system